MDLYKFKFDGIYDSRTLVELKTQGVDHFCFDFNPKSFCFIQERVFLDLLKNHISDFDKVFLHFSSNKDFMVIKIHEEILKIRGNLKNIYFEFDEYFLESNLPNNLNFLLLYQPSIFLHTKKLDGLAGFIFPYNLLEEVNKNTNIVQFYGNFFNHFKNYDLDSKLIVLRLNWDDKINSKCVEIFDFNLVSFPINSEIEICYRNIDLAKLKNKFQLKKNIFKIEMQF
jgi:hypothetical protein